MKTLLEYIVKGIIDESDFEISEKEDNGQLILQIKVKPEAAGLLIGKNGQTIKSIQNIVSVKARKENKNVFVKVVDTD
jgi:uncharacterized protein